MQSIQSYHHNPPSNRSIQLERSFVSCRGESNAKLNSSPQLILHITCMNCGSNIPSDWIDRHASKCTSVTEEVMRNERNSNGLSCVNYKLRRLKEHLINIINEEPQFPNEYDKEMKVVSAKLIQCITQSLHLEEINLINIQSLKEMIKAIDALLLNEKQSLSTQIYVDKTRVLINEKLRKLREPFRQQSHQKGILKNSILALDHNTQSNTSDLIRKPKVVSLSNSGPYEYNSEIQMKIKHDMPQRRTQQLNPREDSINSINSDAISIDLVSFEVNKHNQIISTNTSKSYGSLISKEDHLVRKQSSDVTEKVRINVDTINSEEERLKTKFYKEVFKAKFKKLHSSHKGQHIPHSLIWNECKKQQIAQEKWKPFIFQELNNPIKYSAPKLKSKKKFFSQNFNSMAIIDEENM